MKNKKKIQILKCIIKSYKSYYKLVLIKTCKLVERGKQKAKPKKKVSRKRKLENIIKEK